ncbi:hypothetical protein [Aquipseudomonas alcaligenes]|nr:hypothetical protein [Pseudomonas alcaligenes]SUD19777.1 Uncharacterised protein [Pseudomonas alcaligenes]
MSGQEEIWIADFCYGPVAEGIRSFSNAKAGYGVSNTRKLIWPLLGRCLDEPVLQFAARFSEWPSAERLLAAKGISLLGPVWRDEVDRAVDLDYVTAKRMLKQKRQAHLVVFIDTLASLREAVFAAMRHAPACVTVPGGGVRLQAKSKSDRHYPFCELCWRYSAAAQRLISQEPRVPSLIDARDWRHLEMAAGNSVGSLRFCALHSPTDSKLQYRADLAYRDRFWSAIDQCRIRFVLARKHRLAACDAAVPLSVRQVLELHEEGLSEAQIQQVTLLSSVEIKTSLKWLPSGAYQAIRQAEEHVQLPDERLLRQTAYLLVHGDVQGLLALESALPSLVVTALQSEIYALFEQRLSARTLEIVRLSRMGLAKAEIAKYIGVSRQVVHNALGRDLAKSYLHFLDALAEANMGADYFAGMLNGYCH